MADQGDLSQLVRGWAGYFRYGDSARQFIKIMLDAYRRLAGFIAKRHTQRKRYGFWVLARTPDRFGLTTVNGTIVAPRPDRRWRRGS